MNRSMIRTLKAEIEHLERLSREGGKKNVHKRLAQLKLQLKQLERKAVNNE